MSFNNAKFGKIDFGLSRSNVSLFNYFDTDTDTYATIVASAYFDSVYKLLKKGDYILVEATDDRNIVVVSSVTGVEPVTVVPLLDSSVIPDGAVTAAKLAANAVETAKILDANVTTAKILDANVTTAKILDANVTTDKLAADAIDNTKLADNSVSLEQLDSGIASTHIVVYAGSYTTAGGAAAEDIAVVGALDTDLAFVEIKDDGTTNVTKLQAVAATDKITVTYSADPGADLTGVYQILRAVS